MQSSFGQVRSPFTVELNSSEEKHDEDIEDNSIAIAVDGESMKIRGAFDVTVQLDPTLPKIRVARRMQKLKDMNQIMADLYHLSPPFV